MVQCNVKVIFCDMTNFVAIHAENRHDYKKTKNTLHVFYMFIHIVPVNFVYCQNLSEIFCFVRNVTGNRKRIRGQNFLTDN